ncbi:MAG: alkyl sulfatase dimerization domain-containing protein [Pelagibacterales bacterium]|nr:alkyl sulfatase dimerization domain-containing protein [Pelagibacterales bacterium]
MKLLSVLIITLFFVSCGEQNEISVLKTDINEGLSEEHRNEFRRDIVEVTDGIYSGIGFGLANSIMIETSDGLVIVDTLGSEERATEMLGEFRKISSKPIKAIVYTHNHLDHIGGTTIFAQEGEPEIYAQENILYNIDNISTTIRPIIFERSARQFGIPLPEDKIVHQGIGGFLEINAGATIGLLRPTKTFEDKLDLKIDDLEIELAHVPGETDDHLYVWLPEKKAVMVGDNFYRTFANLYAIRGTKFRNPMEWVHSIDKIRALDAEYLIPSHSRPIEGKENIAKALRDYRDGIQFVHDQTIRHINKGLLPDEIVKIVKLPPHLASSPYLQEFYGSISSYVRSVFSGYIGWFSGNITELHPLDNTIKAQKIRELAERSVPLNDAAKNALKNGEFQWAMELADILLALNPDDESSKKIKAQAAESFSYTQTASNDYYYYQTVAGELRGEIDVYANSNKVTPAQLSGTPMKTIFNSIPVNLNADKSLEVDKKVLFTFTDLEQVFRIHIRRGVAELTYTSQNDEELLIKTDQQSLKEIFAGLKSVPSISLMLAKNEIEVEGGKIEFLKFLSLFQG